MSTSGDHGDGGERDEDFLAAEYALGVLDRDERRRAETRLSTDPAFAQAVAVFEAQLAPLTDEIAPVAPPDAVWARIAAALAPPEPRIGVVPSEQKGGVWQSLAFWRGFGIGAAGIALASLLAVAVIIGRPAPSPATKTLVAALAQTGGKGHVMVTVDRGQGTVMVMPVDMKMPPEHVPELWLIPAGGAPRALGVVDAHKPMKMPIPRALMPVMAENASLAVSVEPPGGSPTGKPTGPVVASGKLAVL